MKFGMGVIYRRLSCRCEFREDRLSNSRRHGNSVGMNELVPSLFIFFSNLGELELDHHLIPLGGCEFMKSLQRNQCFTQGYR